MAREAFPYREAEQQGQVPRILPAEKSTDPVTLRKVSKSLEGSTAVQGGGSCLFVSHRSVESSEIENYHSP